MKKYVIAVLLTYLFLLKGKAQDLNEDVFYLPDYTSYIKSKRINKIVLAVNDTIAGATAINKEMYEFDTSGVLKYMLYSTEYKGRHEMSDTIFRPIGCFSGYECECFKKDVYYSSSTTSCTTNGKVKTVKGYWGVKKFVYENDQIIAAYHRLYITEKPDSFLLTKFIYDKYGKTKYIEEYSNEPKGKVSYDSTDYFKNIQFKILRKKIIEYNANNTINCIKDISFKGGDEICLYLRRYIYDKKGVLFNIIKHDYLEQKNTIVNVEISRE